MRINFIRQGKSDVLQVTDARLVHKNFAGRQTAFTREGDRRVSLVIDDPALAEELIARGWNVKIKPPREEGGEPFMFLEMKIQFNEYGPKIRLETDGNVVELNEDTVDCLDHIYMAHVGIDIRGYDWEVLGKTGRSAYLQSLYVVQQVTDRFADGYPYEESDVY